MEDTMAYCEKCGAYIPDGQTSCLACNYDNAKNKNTKTSGGFAYSFDSNALKNEIEKQKQRIKEESKRWAEEEKARREAQNSKPKEDKATNKETGEMSDGNIRLLSAACYLGGLCILPYIFAPNSQYAKFHANQGIKLFVFGILSNIITGIIPVGALLTLFIFYLIYKGMSAALNNRMEALPVIGNLW